MARSARHAWPGLEPGHTFKDTDLAGKPAAGYFRVSFNPDDTEQKSVDYQEADYLGWVKRTGVKSGPADRFKDDDRSASMFATRQRENFARLREAIEAGRYKILWFWSTSRQTRGDVNIYELAKTSAEAGVLWCVAGQLLNPASEDDLLFLGIHHLMDRQWSWRISKDAKRGKKSSAHAGRPATAPPYGYRRVYDHSGTRPRFDHDEPDMLGGDGRAIEDSPAYIVREIYDRIARGDSLTSIARDLERRGIPIPRKPRKYADQPCRWLVGTVRYIATNPAYIGKRVHRAASHRVKDRHAAILDGVEVRWPPLVTEEQWWAVQRKLSDPSRLTWRPGSKAGHLLAGVARCGKCLSPLYAAPDPAGTYTYTCSRRRCVVARLDWLDAYAEDRIVSWLADPAVYARLAQNREDDTAAAAAARADIERLQHQLEECRVNGEDPDADAVFWERRARSLTVKLKEAERLAWPASLSPVLADAVGPEAADRWVALPLPVRRQILKMTADIRLGKGKRGGDARYRRALDESRVEWHWLLGPGADQPRPVT
jgi:site-specific DNA recombinase